MKKVLRNIGFGFFLLLLFLPALQKGLGLFPEKPLNGAFVSAEKPEFNWKGWLSGDFQSKYDRYLEDQIGFRSFFVRVKNQLDFSLFRKTNAEGVVVGKNDFLFEYDYIRDYTGKDFVGEDFIRKKLMRASFVQHYLKDSLDINFIVVFEPGKASFYPGHIPDEYLSDSISGTNYKIYSTYASDLGIRHLDFNEFFLSMKDTASYPLFPRYGTHWSEYGMWQAADSLLRFIEGQCQEELRDVRLLGYKVVKKALGTDNDVEKPLNLLFPLPSWYYAYPQLGFDSTWENYRPMVLAVADSYYWNIFNTGIPKYIFANQAFWYFNARVYPDTYYHETWVKDLDFKQEIEKQDFIILMVTERFLHVFDWQFIDMVYAIYAPGWLRDEVYININRILSNEQWFTDLIKKAEQQGQPLSVVLEREARYLYFKEKPANYFLEFGIEHYMNVILDDSTWYDYIVDKAEQNDIPVEEQLRGDAEFVFWHDHPALFNIFKGIASIIREFESDEKSMEILAKEAAHYGSPYESYIRSKAFHLYREREIRKTENAIRSTPGWYRDVQAKSVEKGIPLDTMIRMDAEYIWSQKMKIE